jgi:hypothetical protein
MSLSPASVVTDMLTTQDRSLAGPPLPSKHLTLEHVEYDARHPLDTDAAADAASCSAGTTLARYISTHATRTRGTRSIKMLPQTPVRILKDTYRVIVVYVDASLRTICGRKDAAADAASCSAGTTSSLRSHTLVA